MTLEYSSLVFGLAKEFCGTVKNLQLLKTKYKTKINMCPKLKILFNIQPMLTKVQKSHTKKFGKLMTKPINAKSFIYTCSWDNVVGIVTNVWL